MKIEAPKIDSRKFSDLLNILKGLVPHYTPEWKASDEDKDSGVALLKIFSHISESVVNHLNQMPRKNFVAFLDMLGIKLLPAQTARVPLTFKLVDGTDNDFLIPAKTQASADKTDKHDELPFETEKNLWATTSNLKEVISTDPFNDNIFVHTANVTSKDGKILDEQIAFTLFSGANQQEHSLYFGHTDIFNMESAGKIIIDVTLADAGTGNSSLNLEWSYWGENKEKEIDEWVPLEIESDGTNGFSQNGELMLLKTLEGKVKEEKLADIFTKTNRIEIKDKSIGEIKTRWVRCRLKDPLSIGSSIILPTIDTIFLKAEPGDSIPPDAGFFNDVPIDWKQVSIEANVVECQGEIEIPLSAAAIITNPPKHICLDSVDGFSIGDIIDIFTGENFKSQGIITNIDFDQISIQATLESNIDVLENDISKNKIQRTYKINPFGSKPRLYDSFYIGSQESLSKKDATITLKFSLTHLDTFANKSDSASLNPKLSWEFWNGNGWQAITILKDDTNRLLKDGDEMAIEFNCPADIYELEVNGQKNYWIRARIVGGDYGRDEYSIDKSNEQKIKIDSKYNIPIIRDLKIDYRFNIKEKLQYCLSYNNLDFQDETSNSSKEEEFIIPFIPMEDTNLNFYLGFDKPLIDGPIRIFFDAKELPFNDETKPKMDWNYENTTDWALLDYLDESEGMITQGHLELIGPIDFISHQRFGEMFYWIRGSLVKGSYDSNPEIHGIYPNTTWAIQAETIKDEILGSSDGEPNQIFSFLKFPVLKGEEIRVKEILSEEEKQNLISSYGVNTIFEVKNEKGETTETWVLWSEVSDFFDSSSDSRHYTLDRAIGQIQFGDGLNGMIPAGFDDNIKAFSYQAGGGKQGNVDVNEIKSLKSAVAGVDSAVNHVAADGGADTATLDEMLEIGPAMISHRGRAVTIEDFEWLAKQASRKVVKARCLPNTNNNRQTEIGSVTVIIVPDSTDDMPFPSLELKRIVQEFLESCSSTTLAFAKHIYVEGPLYLKINISVDIYIDSIDAASEVEREARSKLNTFLHPLTGGSDGTGWDFGRDISASDVYGLLEDIDGIDHVENLNFNYNSAASNDIVFVGKDYLVASGTHTINLQLKKILNTEVV